MRQLLNFLEPLFYLFLALLGVSLFFLGIAIAVALSHHMLYVL
jgi:hypothetical protein